MANYKVNLQVDLGTPEGDEGPSPEVVAKTLAGWVRHTDELEVEGSFIVIDSVEVGGEVTDAAKALLTADAPSTFSNNAAIVPADKLSALRRALVDAGVLHPGRGSGRS